MLDDFLRLHDGVLTLSHARLAGLSQDAINRRVRSGRWIRCSRGVYFVNDRPFTDAARVRAAVWGSGADAAASGLAAAWWHGMTKYPPKLVEVTVPRAAERPKRDGIRTRRRDLTPADVLELRGLRVTEFAFTVVEAAARRGGGVEILDGALQRHTTLLALWRAHLRNKGRHGSPRARLMLQAADDGTRSAAERLLAKLLTAAGITGWVANLSVGGYAVDFGFPASKVALEADGFAFHSDQAAFQRDRKRQNHLILLGWQVLRFTWLDLTECPERVVAEIRRATCAV